MSNDILDIQLVPSWVSEKLEIEALSGEGANQSEEKISAMIGAERVSFDMHDYKSIYRVPWLYDAMLYDFLSCRTPQGLAERLKAYVIKKGVQLSRLRVLEIGAGSGAFGVTLRATDCIQELVGLDILREAKLAAERDRPYLYDNYLVDDLTALTPNGLSVVEQLEPTCVAVASATGWGNHIPVEGFQAAFDLLQPGGVFVFHVKPNDPDPECIALVQWIDHLAASEKILDVASGSLFHRKSVAGDDILYDYRIGIKST